MQILHFSNSQDGIHGGVLFKSWQHSRTLTRAEQSALFAVNLWVERDIDTARKSSWLSHPGATHTQKLVS